MDKTTELIKFLDKMPNQGIFTAVDGLKMDFQKQVKGVLERDGWDNTQKWASGQVDAFSHTDDKLTRNMRHLYYMVYCKMWKLNKVEKKGGEVK